MRLKTIEIKGFKSFADKTVLHFTENMTGVVGPNGCGKSNTVDAIRWVLGEQKSKMLRLEKMENIIFNGSKKRQPAGRAEVSLTLENTRNLLPTEYSTVTISRVLYRNGDSEYRLNDVRCRLKDITDLFLDTGISSDSYAIIELKMIDEILNDKDNSRSRLFEQAAGISKYKVRKRETLSKLAATDADLTRVEDLLFEIEKNLKSLEKQAKQTEKYYKLREQYKELSIELALHQLEGHKGSINNLKNQQQTETDRKLGYETTISQLEAGIEHKKLYILEKEKALNEEQKRLNELTTKLQTKENEKNLLAQNIRFLQDKKQNLGQQITAASQLTDNLNREIAFLAHDLEGEQAQMEAATQKVETLRQAAESVKQRHNAGRQHLDAQQYKDKEAERQLFEQEKKIAVFQSQKDNLQHQISENQIRFQTRQEEIAEMKTGLQQTDEELSNAQEYLQHLLAEEENLQEQIAAATRQVETLQPQLNDLHRRYDARQNEYRLLKSMVDSMEGFPDSVKYLKQQSNQWNQSAAPLLLDVLNCPDEYKVALENYLKTWLNHYVVNNRQEAAAAMQLLDRNNKGKAGFFILEDLTATSQTRPALFEAGLPHGAVEALQIVSVQPQYRPLLAHLLYGVYIVPGNFEPTMEQLQTGAVFVSGNGKFIRRQTAFEGGSAGAYEGKRIGKRQQLEQLQTEIETTGTQINQLQNTIEQQKNQLRQVANTLNNKRSEISRHKQTIDGISKKSMSFKLRIESLQSYIQESETKDTGLHGQINQLQQQIQQLMQQLSGLKDSYAAQRTLTGQAETAFAELNRQLAQANEEFNRQNIEFHKQQNRLNSIEQSLRFKENQLAETDKQLADNNNQLTQTNEQLTAQTAALQETEEVLQVFYRKKSEHEKLVSQAESAYYEARGTIADVEKELREQNRLRQQSEALLNSLEHSLTELKIKLLSLKERLDIEFQVNIDDIMERAPSEEFTLPDLEEKVEKMRTQIARFGEINPLAIEAYNEIKERYDFIIAQREDLVEAKKLLQKTMREIEKTATEKFMDAFNKVREHFIEVFRALFTDEDTCDLVLTNTEDPLESEIDIIARPKGKRPQSINQLSGGEKSLTALALVFALYLYKPAPFCILDEVDAPLDDVNVSKFSNMIRRFSENSQFILVTHNKNTMAAVDVIYGVTMPEEGVSKVVPVDFRSLTNEYNEVTLNEK